MSAISRLLGAQELASPWGNLGAWQPGTSDEPYDAAACRLAQYHADAIALGSDDHLLELGAGAGASLRLWARHGVREVITLDVVDTRCPSELAHDFHHRAIRSAFDAPWPALPAITAIIAVDALYHARDLARVLANIAQHLTRNGRWAITTLQIDPVLSPRQQALLRAQLRACGIGWRGVWHSAMGIDDSAAEPGVFERSGLVIERVDDLTQRVMMGFAHAIAHRERGLTPTQRLHPAWWKLALTARLCRALAASGHVRYVLVAGRR